MQTTNAFEQILQGLNPKQTEAVNAIDGPVLVVAGPGTGKTHILSARIGNILQKTDAQPENILCLTYTDAGVKAMRERLIEFIGPTANQVYIHTFHSFCNSVIQAHPSVFGSYDLQPIDDLEKIDLIRELLKSLSIDNPLHKGMRREFANERQLKNLFELMKKELIGVEQFNKMVDSYIEEMSNPETSEFVYKRKYKNFKPGDFKAKYYDKMAAMERLKAGIALYPKYIETMVKRDLYDYADMILWVINAFKDHPYLLSIYQEQFQYFLVDEFQDTSGAQMEILDLLISYWDSPNVFAVGDDDQCVYEFQGARIDNIIDFMNQYDDLNLIVLDENYRSSQHILDLCTQSINHNEYRLIEKAKDRFGETKKLISANTRFHDSRILPVIKSYKTHLHELTDIVNDIEQKIKDGVPPNQMAILYAKTSQSADLKTLLQERQIPYNSKNRINILEEPLIRNIRLLLRYASEQVSDNGADDFELFQMMHLPFFDIDPVDIAKMAHALGDIRHDEKPPWRVAISDYALMNGANVENIKAFYALSGELSLWAKKSNAFATQGYIEYIINRAGVLTYILNNEDQYYLMELLTSFYNDVKRRIEKKPRITLKELLDHYEAMDRNDLSVDYTKSIYADDGIFLTTAHGSKGLEFEYVYMLEVTKSRWDKSGSGFNNFSYPPEINASDKNAELEARRRLFFVAMSRSKSYLQISYPEYNDKEKGIERSAFLDELSSERFELLKVEVPPSEVLKNQLIIIRDSAKAKISLAMEDLINARLEDFRMSPSALNAYIRCPLAFYYTYILKVPGTQSEAATYGEAMHYALEKLFDDMKEKGDGSWMTEDAFIKVFENRMDYKQGNFSQSGLKFRKEKGKENLVKIYQDNIDHWIKEVETEQFIDDVNVQGVPIKGMIDKVERIGKNEVRLIDYKSGKYDPKNARPASDKLKEGGSYWRQLVFYKLLFEYSIKSKGAKARSAKLIYLDMDDKSNFPEHEVQYTPEQESALIEILTTTYQKIQERDFNTGCEDQYCQWCNFVRSTGQNINQFAEIDEDALRNER